jgi:hypothetical protein
MSRIATVLGLALMAGPGSSAPPSVSLRAEPRVSDAPARVVFTALLSGGEDGEELYCPDVEWAWGDGTRSVHEGSCPPYKVGETAVQREFTVQHEYTRPARPRVSVILRKGKRTLGRGSVNVIIARKGPSAAYGKWR